MSTMPPRRIPQPGEPAPWFVASSTSAERYNFDSAGGRYVVLCFLGSGSDTYSKAVVDGFLAQPACFDDRNACFFGVSVDRRDREQSILVERLPGYRFLWDFDFSLSTLYGIHRADRTYTRCTLVLDPRLRVLAVVAFDATREAEAHVARVLRVLKGQPPIAEGVVECHAPVLVVPRVFEPEFCERLIACYNAGNPERSGFMRQQGEKTVLVFDDDFKRRRDVEVVEPSLRMACRTRLENRLKPEILKAFQFTVSYAERYMVAGYDSAEQGFFRAHRDNTTKGTAHRRFAVTINLNTGAYAGGELRFPEYGPRTYEAPLGGAIVFSCSLLHEALPVTRGIRYAFLPFLYDEAAEKLRAQNASAVDLRRQAG